MSVRPFFGLLLAMGLVGCGGTATVYRGTMTTTQTGGGASSTTTVTGQTLVVFSGGEAGALLVDLGDFVVSMSRTGDALTATANQTVAVADSSDSSNQTRAVSSGQGTLTGQTLSLNLTGTTSFSSPQGMANSSFTLSFTGTKI